MRKEKAYAGGRKLTVPEAAGAELGLLDSWQGQRAGRMGEVRGSGSWRQEAAGDRGQLGGGGS